MVIEYLKKDLTTIERGIVAHGVNCQGKMGRGVAAAIRKKWPVVYNEYTKITPNENLLGLVQYVEIKSHSLIVANCFTQVFYGSSGLYADIEAIDACVSRLCTNAYYEQLPIYMPKIGCGLGGLKWEQVQPIIDTHVNRRPNVQIFVCDI